MKWAKPTFQFLLPLLIAGLLAALFQTQILPDEANLHAAHSARDKDLLDAAIGEGASTAEWWPPPRYPWAESLARGILVAAIPFFLLLALYFRVWGSRAGTPSYTGWGIRVVSPQIPWAFLLAMVLAYATYFTAGSIPPLAVAAVTLAVYYSLKFGRHRIASLVAFVLVGLAGLYLNRYSPLDLVWGIGGAVLSASAIDLGVTRKLKQAASRRSPTDRP